VQIALLCALWLCSVPAVAAPGHRCATAAIQQARALLIFHAGAQAEVAVDDTAKVLAPMRNPANPRQRFDVLEVQGHVYRADYRMRLIYAQVPGACVLMGQEIIERSSL
jgi:hypothetical protein